MPHDPYQALYVHIPFCAKRCFYCDFTTSAVPFDDKRIDDYMEDLVLRIRRAAKAGKLASVKTVYLGGGTPSYVGSARLSFLLYALSASMFLTPEVECSMEANPESVNASLIRDIWALGVNRLSIGVQSFDDEVLRSLGRIHDAAGAHEAIRAAHERFENVSVDLMCGIPGQSEESFAASVQEAIDAGVTHISIYPLTVEKNTPLYAAAMKGRFPWPDEDVEAQHMALAADLLRANGFERYEVASYARPGYQCRHNIAYWSGVPYLGLGRSAVTMTQNASARMREQDGAIIESLDAHQMMAEDLMLGMRMTKGISDAQVAHAQEELKGLLDVLEWQRDAGLVEHEQGAWRPTTKGWLCGNELYGSLFDL